MVVRASGLEYLRLVTGLLQRVRVADPHAGLWEAADLQWWWRMPRASDDVAQLFWVDDDGPVAAVAFTDWGRFWGCDPIVVPPVGAPPISTVWSSAIGSIDALGLEEVETLVRDDDEVLRSLAAASGFVATDERSGECWLDAGDRSDAAPLPDGFTLVDRAGGDAGPHWARRRNGAAVESRLRECSLYDPALDLAVRAPDGRIAGYSLFWFDPVTSVGLLEPMRVEDEFQRRGLARAMISEGLERLARRGARRFKVGFATGAARALYEGAGFRVTSTATTYRWTRTPDLSSG